MSLHSFQFGLRHLFIAITLCNVAFFLLVILSPESGTRKQLPAAEQAVLTSMEQDGLRFTNEFRCSMGAYAKSSIRWFSDGKYHVVAIELSRGDEPRAWIPNCRKLPMLRRLRLQGATKETAEFVQRELRGTPVRVEHGGTHWVAAEISKTE
jgi:hypothetical protein